MTTINPSAGDKAWAMIEIEKRRDRFLRRVSIAAWSGTFAIALVFTILTGIQVVEMSETAMAGGVPWSTAIAMATPLVVSLGKLFLLIAVMATVGIFLRLRTASLTEIQLRLAALEDILASQPDSRK